MWEAMTDAAPCSYAGLETVTAALTRTARAGRVEPATATEQDSDHGIRLTIVADDCPRD